LFNVEKASSSKKNSLRVIFLSLITFVGFLARVFRRRRCGRSPSKPQLPSATDTSFGSSEHSKFSKAAFPAGHVDRLFINQLDFDQMVRDFEALDNLNSPPPMKEEGQIVVELATEFPQLMSWSSEDRLRLSRLFKVAQNSRALASRQLRDTKRFVDEADENIRRLEDLLRAVGMALPSVIDGDVTVVLPEKCAKRIELAAHGLILDHGEAQLGAPWMSLNGQSNMGGSPAFDPSMFGTGWAVPLPPPGPDSVSKKSLREDVEAELARQGFKAVDLHIEVDQVMKVIHIDVAALVAIVGGKNHILDRDALEALLRRKVPAGIKVETPLL
jgi:hypothetical protein